MSELDTRIETLTRSATRRAVVRVEAIAAGLGAHHFFRVHCDDGESVIARVPAERPAGSGPEPPLEPTRAFLEEAGLPVPRSVFHCEDLDLLEDLGSLSLRDVAAAAGPEDERVRALYRQACGLIPRLQALAAPASPPPAFSRTWRDFIPIKRRRALEVALPAWLGRTPTTGERDALLRGFDVVESELAAAPLRFSHRDFQSSNLMCRRDREGRDELLMIDLQGAWMAPPEYDLVCLLRDSYVALPDRWVEELAETTRRALPDPPEHAVFARRFDLLTIARKSKDDAFFHEATARGDDRYAGYHDTNRRYLGAAARRLAERHPCFATWASWLGDAPTGREAPRCAP